MRKPLTHTCKFHSYAFSKSRILTPFSLAIYRAEGPIIVRAEPESKSDLVLRPCIFTFSHQRGKSCEVTWLQSTESLLDGEDLGSLGTNLGGIGTSMPSLIGLN